MPWASTREAGLPNLADSRAARQAFVAVHNRLHVVEVRRVRLHQGAQPLDLLFRHHRRRSW
jgi:hypothetical protein